MKMIRPLEITPAMVTASNLTESVAAYSGTALYLNGDRARDDTARRIYESLHGASLGTATMTIASPCVVTRAAHGLSNGDTVSFTTTGALPTGLAVNTIYYVLNKTDDTFQLSATSGGSAINTSGGQSGTHTLYSDPNIGFAQTDTLHWADAAPLNADAMYDEFNQTQSEAADEIAQTIEGSGIVNAIAFLNLEAGSIEVTITDDTAGVVYDETHSLASNDNVGDYYDYFFEPVVRRTDLHLDGLPAYSDCQFDIAIINDGGVAKCGNLVMGSQRELGFTVYGATFSIISGGRKLVDDYGNVTIVPGTYRKTGTFEVVVAKRLTDEGVRLLTQYRDTPIVYIGTDEFSSSIIFGFYRDFRMVVEYPLQSKLSLEIEGLT